MPRSTEIRKTPLIEKDVPSDYVRIEKPRRKILIDGILEER